MLENPTSSLVQILPGGELNQLALGGSGRRRVVAPRSPGGSNRAASASDVRQRSPALAGSIGAGRRWTVSMISLLSIPWR
jgi:hypothetical protein